jgi:trans-2,3-dihydro-3-hydroxyanthranilate isomerase
MDAIGDKLMRRLRYVLLDVFTDRAFGGNPLAVFLNGRGLDTAQMQTLAKELNLSEITFVLPPADPTHDYRVRIFTPALEMPMAGHPTIGTAYALALEQMISTSGNETLLRLEEQVGLITVQLTLQQGQPTQAWMRQPTPHLGDVWSDRAQIAELLGLSEDDFVSDLPIQAASASVPFLYVPLNTLAAVGRASLRLDLWERLLKSSAAPSVYVFSTQTSDPNVDIHARMFAPIMGIAEDPATGAASGPLALYATHYQLVDHNPIRIEQGMEMGRHSQIAVRMEQAADGSPIFWVGGQAVVVGEGAIFVA